MKSDTTEKTSKDNVKDNELDSYLQDNHNQRVTNKSLNQFVKRLFSVSIFTFGYNFITTAEYVYFRIILRKAGFSSEIIISILLSSALIALCFGAIIGGIINDRVKSRFGQRAPSIFLGGILASISFLTISLTTKYISNMKLLFFSFLIFLILSHLFIGIAYSPWMALTADLFQRDERNWAGISISIFSATGALISMLIFSVLIEHNLHWMVWIVIGMIIIIVVIMTIIAIPKTNAININTNKTKDISAFFVSMWKMGGLFWIALLILNIFWSFSSHLVETSLVDSLIIRFNVTSLKASLSSNLLMGIYFGILFIPIIYFANKIKKIYVGIVASFFYGLFCFLLAIIKDFYYIYIIVFIGSIGNILLNVLQISLPIDYLPKGREASFLGIFFAFGTSMKPLATFIQGVLLEENKTNLLTSVFGGYPWVFILATIVCSIAIPLNIFMVKLFKKSKGTIF